MFGNVSYSKVLKPIVCSLQDTILMRYKKKKVLETSSPMNVVLNLLLNYVMIFFAVYSPSCSYKNIYSLFNLFYCLFVCLFVS